MQDEFAQKSVRKVAKRWRHDEDARKCFKTCQRHLASEPKYKKTRDSAKMPRYLKNRVVASTHPGFEPLVGDLELIPLLLDLLESSPK